MYIHRLPICFSVRLPSCVTVPWEEKWHHITVSFLLYVLSMMSYGLEHPLGHLGSSAPAVSPPKFLCTHTLLVLPAKPSRPLTQVLEAPDLTRAWGGSDWLISRDLLQPRVLVHANSIQSSACCGSVILQACFKKALNSGNWFMRHDLFVSFVNDDTIQSKTENLWDLLFPGAGLKACLCVHTVTTPRFAPLGCIPLSTCSDKVYCPADGSERSG